MHELLDSNPDLSNIFLSIYVHGHLTLYIQCLYLVYTWAEHDLSKYVHEHICKNLYVCVYTWSEHDQHEPCSVYVHGIYI